MPRRRVVPHLAVDGKRRRRYDRQRSDVDALQGANVGETRTNITVAALVNTLVKLDAVGFNFDGSPTGTLRYRFMFAAKLRDGSVHVGHHDVGLIPDDEVGIAMMYAGAACIRSVLDRRT